MAKDLDANLDGKRDAIERLEPRIRRDIEALAAFHQVSAEALMLEFAAAYIRLLREVPGALPRNPLEPIVAGAKRKAKS